jgi:tetratricopeptide (TPR) repeat protein
MKTIFSILLISVLMHACTLTNQREIGIGYHQIGKAAESERDYPLAEKNYSKLLEIAKQEEFSQGDIASITYNLGRVKGYLCKYTEAEPLLLEALELEKKTSGPVSAFVIKRHLELARFYFDHAEYAKSIRYYKRVIPMAISSDLEKTDPMALIKVHDEYSEALDRSGETALSKKARFDADFLRKKHPHAQLKSITVRYNQDCE